MIVNYSDLLRVSPRTAIPILGDSAFRRRKDPDSGAMLIWPSFASLDQARERSVREASHSIHEIRIFPDHGPEWPLWDVDFDTTACPNDYGLSKRLSDRLLCWKGIWQERADFYLKSSGTWPTWWLPEGWFVEGYVLACETAEEAWHVGDVIPQFLSGLPRP